MNGFRSVRRSAFTLVELLVVIVIIGILIGLLVPTIGAVLSNTKTAAIGIEIGNLAQSVEAYRQQYGAYPPDFANDSVGDVKQMTNHLARYFRFRQPADQSVLGVENLTLDPAEALVFWLHGFAGDTKFPLSKREPLLPGGPPLKGDKVWFEFDQSRLLDKDEDGYPEYYPANSDLPYVYIRNDSYGVPDASGSGLTFNTIPAMQSSGSAGIGIRAYAAELQGTLIKRFAEAEKFQIICAGADGDFGPPSLAVYPDGIGYSEADEDNITNFSGGNTLQDSIP